MSMQTVKTCNNVHTLLDMTGGCIRVQWTLLLFNLLEFSRKFVNFVSENGHNILQKQSYTFPILATIHHDSSRCDLYCKIGMHGDG